MGDSTVIEEAASTESWWRNNQKLIERGFGAGRVEGRVEGKVEGIRESLLRLIERAAIPLTDSDRTRIQACDDIATLQRWLDNVFGAKTAADILS